MSSDSGDGTADCAHLGLAPLDVDLRMFWRTTAVMLHFVMDTGWPAQPAPVRSTQVVISWPEAEQKTEVYLLIGVDGAISKGVSESSLPVWTNRHGVKHSRRVVRADASADVADSGDLRVLLCFRAPSGDTTKGNCVWQVC